MIKFGSHLILKRFSQTKSKINGNQSNIARYLSYALGIGAFSGGAYGYYSKYQSASENETSEQHQMEITKSDSLKQSKEISIEYSEEQKVMEIIVRGRNSGRYYLRDDLIKRDCIKTFDVDQTGGILSDIYGQVFLWKWPSNKQSEYLAPIAIECKKIQLPNVYMLWRDTVKTVRAVKDTKFLITEHGYLYQLNNDSIQSVNLDQNISISDVQSTVEGNYILATDGSLHKFDVDGQTIKSQKISDTKFKQISCGQDHCLLISKSQELFGIGSNLYGQLSHNKFDSKHEVPTKLTSFWVNLPNQTLSEDQLLRIKDIKAVGNVSYVHLESNQRTLVSTFGDGTSNLIGMSNAQSKKYEPSIIQSISNLQEFNEKENKIVPIRVESILSSGSGDQDDGHVIAILDTSYYNFGKDVYAWGSNKRSQLDKSLNKNIFVPSLLSPVVSHERIDRLQVYDSKNDKHGPQVRNLALAPGMSAYLVY